MLTQINRSTHSDQIHRVVDLSVKKGRSSAAWWFLLPSAAAFFLIREGGCLVVKSNLMTCWNMFSVRQNGSARRSLLNLPASFPNTDGVACGAESHVHFSSRMNYMTAKSRCLSALNSRRGGTMKSASGLTNDGKPKRSRGWVSDGMGLAAAASGWLDWGLMPSW